MQRTAHGAHLVRLTRMGWVNCHLVREEEDGLTLVDTSISRSAGGILQAMARATSEAA